jgi:dihydroneopterin aldolase
MDKISLKKLRFYGYHGVLEEENKLGQKFTVNLELFADLKQACVTDAVKDTINYALVYALVKEIVEREQFNLIERLADEIITRIFQTFQKVNEIIVEIEKPEAPVNGIYDYFSVQLRRKRDE